MQNSLLLKKNRDMKKIIIAVLMGCLFQVIKAQEPGQSLVGIYKSTTSRACIVLYMSDTRLRAKAYEDLAIIKRNVYTKEYLSGLLADKNCPDFIVSYNESVFENLLSWNDPIEFTIPQNNAINNAILIFFTHAGTKFKPLKIRL